MDFYFYYDGFYDCWVKKECVFKFRNNYKELVTMMDLITMKYIGKHVYSHYDFFKYFQPFDSDLYKRVQDSEYWTNCACSHDIAIPYEVYLIEFPSIKIRIGSSCILKFEPKNIENDTEKCDRERFISELDRVIAKRKNRICKLCYQKIDKRTKEGKESLCTLCYTPMNRLDEQQRNRIKKLLVEIKSKNKFHANCIINSTIDDPNERENLRVEINNNKKLDSYKPFYENGLSLIEIYESKDGIEHLIKSLSKDGIKKYKPVYDSLKKFIISKIKNDKKNKNNIIFFLEKYNIKCIKIKCIKIKCIKVKIEIINPENYISPVCYKYKGKTLQEIQDKEYLEYVLNNTTHLETKKNIQLFLFKTN